MCFGQGGTGIGAEGEGRRKKRLAFFQQDFCLCWKERTDPIFQMKSTVVLALPSNSPCQMKEPKSKKRFCTLHVIKTVL